MATVNKKKKVIIKVTQKPRAASEENKSGDPFCLN